MPTYWSPFSSSVCILTDLPSRRTKRGADGRKGEISIYSSHTAGNHGSFAMALNIKSPETDRLARHLAEATGETLTETVTVALQERLERILGRRRTRGLRDDIRRIQERIAALPRRDERTDEEILGYNEAGLPS